MFVSIKLSIEKINPKPSLMSLNNKENLVKRESTKKKKTQVVA
jgi:hypothetical protein